jgi:hypothetical protein
MGNTDDMTCAPVYQAQTRRITRAALVVVALFFISLVTSCANLARVRDESIPKLLEPRTTGDLPILLAKLEPFGNLQALRASRFFIQFIDAEASDKYRTADGALVLQRPDKIRLIIQIPFAGTRIAEMISESNRFKVAIYLNDYRRFLIGTNNSDYSRWREKLGKKEQSALLNARPFHFTEALMTRPLETSNPRFAYGLEEALVEEPDTRPEAKKKARVLRSFYVVSEVELATTQGGASRVRRRFWFDRTDNLTYARQQIFDERGDLSTEVQYSHYMKLSDSSPHLWPSVVLVARPHDNYSARLTFNQGRFEVNPTELASTVFALENTEGLPVTDLDLNP